MPTARRTSSSPTPGQYGERAPGQRGRNLPIAAAIRSRAFQTPNIVTNLRLPTFRRAVGVADFNGDHIPDIAATNYDSADVSILLGRGDGSFDPQRRFDATAAPFDLDIGDLNGDGVPDLVVADASSMPGITVAALLGRGDGSFQPQRSFRLAMPLADNIPWTAIRIADLNQDGKADVILSGAAMHGVSIFLETETEPSARRAISKRGSSAPAWS